MAKQRFDKHSNRRQGRRSGGPISEPLEARVLLATFTVSNANDTGAGSLRTALTSANGSAAADTIVFSSFFNTPRTISLATPLPTIPAAGGTLTITGPGASTLTVTRAVGAPLFRIFDSLTASLAISGMTISGGYAGHIEDGGGIRVGGTSPNVSLDGLILSDNHADDVGNGGAVYLAAGGFLTVRNCTITNNSGAIDRGGIYCEGGGSLVVEDSTIANNFNGGVGFRGTVSATPPAGYTPSTIVLKNSTFADNGPGVGGPSPGAYDGAGMRCQFLTGTLLIQNCTFSGNETYAGPGGAVHLGSGNIIAQNSTLTNNEAGGFGGGAICSDGQSITVQNCTITDNRANGTDFGGGGVARTVNTTGSITVQNSVISGNVASNGPDIYRVTSATTVNVNFSAIGDSDGFTLSGTSGDNLPFGTNVLLGALADNGGLTQTMRPQVSSPLVNAGSNALASGLINDQRGSGFARIVGAAVDIGALERQDPKTFSVINANDNGIGSLRNAIDQSNLFEGNDTITFDSAFFATPRTISLLTALPAFGASNGSGGMTMTGPGSSRLTVRRDPAAANFRVFDSGITSTLTMSGMTVSDGFASGSAGGGLRSASIATVTLDDMVFLNNTADTHGGAIDLPTANSLILRNSTISGSIVTAGGGGAIDLSSVNAGSVIIDACTISGNSANGAGAAGGAIRWSGFGNPTITNSTFSNNSAAGSGGAISLLFTNGTLALQNSTFAGNTAGTSGGAVAITSGFGSLNVQDSTISGNTANGAAAGTGGGGLARITTSAGSITVANSVVSGNNNGNSPDIFRSSTNTTVNVNFSAIGSLTGFALSGTSGNNLPFGTNLLLGSLANNGGPTQTMLPGSGSPLINAGSNGLVPIGLGNDQRGATFARVRDGSVDIGAIEIPAGSYVVINNTDSGAGSLRQALINVNATATADTIVFDSAFFASSRVISLLTVLPTIPAAGGALTVTGPGASALTVQRDPSAGNFRILDSSTSTLTLSGMTFSGGSATGTAGGGLRALGTTPLVTLDDMAFLNNSTNSGGAIFINTGGFLSIRNSTVSNNTATGSGGGIQLTNGGSLLMENCTISDNDSGASSTGGGIWFSGTASATPPSGFTPNTLVIRNSTINGNTTGGSGGGVTVSSFTGTLLAQNCTITGNTASGLNSSSGGGISLSSGNGSITLQNCTVSGNTAGATVAGFGGGGVRTVSTTGTLTIQNSVVSGNTNTNAPDVLSSGGAPVNVNFSAIGSNTGFVLSGTSGDNRPFGENLMLGALANNGGPTQTMLPSTGSPLINNGSNALVPPGLTTDQRGSGFARIVGSAVDIGAVEIQAQPPTLVNSQFNFLTSQSLTFTFSEAVTFPNGINAAFTVQNLTNPGTVNTTAVQNAATVTVTFTPAILPDANFRATVVAANVAGAGGPMAADFLLNFFFLNGDANRDARVNVNDFTILAGNFNQSNRNFSQGDFNYDGVVNINDFTILAARFGSALGAAAAGTPRNLVFGDELVRLDDRLVEQLRV